MNNKNKTGGNKMTKIATLDYKSVEEARGWLNTQKPNQLLKK